MATEIFYCNLIVTYKKKKVKIEKVVYKHIDGYYDNIRELKKNGITEERIKVDEVEVIHSMGFDNITAVTYTEVKKSDETRNKITGAYE